MTQQSTIEEGRRHNVILAIGGLNGFVSTEVQNSTPMLRLKLGIKIPCLRQYSNRYHAIKQSNHPLPQAAPRPEKRATTQPNPTLKNNWSKKYLFKIASHKEKNLYAKRKPLRFDPLTDVTQRQHFAMN